MGVKTECHIMSVVGESNFDDDDDDDDGDGDGRSLERARSD